MKARFEQLASAPVAYHTAVNPDPTHNTAIVQLCPFGLAGVTDFYVKTAVVLGAKVSIVDADSVGSVL